MTVAPAAPQPADLGALPVWDLKDLYPGRDSPALQADLKKAAEDAKAFRLRFQGKLAQIDGAALGQAVASYESIQEVLGRIMSYAQLVHAGNMTDPEIGRFYQTMQERVTDISTELLFFTLELNRLDESVVAEKLKAPALAQYRPWLRDLRAFRPHQLSDEVEQLLHEKRVAGRSAWIRLFDETHGAICAFPSTAGADRDRGAEPAVRPRRQAAQGGGQEPRQGARRECPRRSRSSPTRSPRTRRSRTSWRKFARPVSSRNLANFVEDEVVDALVDGGEGRLSRALAPLLQAEGQVVRRRPARLLGPQRAAAGRRRPQHRLAGGASDRARRPMPPSRRSWRRSAGSSSTRAGSTRRRGRARRRAPSPIRRCRARIPICCSTTTARRAT